MTKTSTIQMLRVSGQTFWHLNLKKYLSEYYPLLSVLIGFILVSLSVGPYHNGDTSWEYDAVSGVLKTGLPVANGGILMDQPPVGFYIQALFFKVFGMSINNGTFLVTLFGLECVALVYGIGRVACNQTTGFFASVLFAFSPWHLILSRSFLIDVQCLFFSLLTLFVGLIAVRRGSFKLFLASGIFFTVAFNTKLYAAFTLIPLLMFFLYYGPKKIKQMLKWLAAFLVPVFLVSFLWYETISGLGMSAVTMHTDFTVQNTVGVIPSYFFVSNFLASYGLGWFFIDAAALSLLLCLVQRRLFGKFLIFDLVCLVTIVCVASVDIFLGVILNLKAPYMNAIKYDYQVLPFFSFLAAGLFSKSISLFRLGRIKSELRKVTLSAIALLGFVLVAAAVLYNISFVHLFSTWNYLIFRVDPNVNLGYSLFNSNPIGTNSLGMVAQFAGFAFALSGILWAGRHKLGLLKSRLSKSLI
jgi:4-amino-4-deoxy-L-arabinose transferase-like glycosyltransferase